MYGLLRGFLGVLIVASCILIIRLQLKVWMKAMLCTLVALLICSLTFIPIDNLLFTFDDVLEVSKYKYQVDGATGVEGEDTMLIITHANDGDYIDIVSREDKRLKFSSPISTESKVLESADGYFVVRYRHRQSGEMYISISEGVNTLEISDISDSENSQFFQAYGGGDKYIAFLGKSMKNYELYVKEKTVLEMRD